MSKSQEIKFTTEIEYKDKRVTVKVEGTYSPAYSEQEYPGAHIWHNKASFDIDSVILVDDGTEIEDQISESNRTNLERAGVLYPGWRQGLVRI